MVSVTHFPAMPDFPPPKINSSRPVLSPCQADFVGGDFRGLQALADGIYGFVSSSNSGPFSNIVDDVTQMVKDDDAPLVGYHPGANGGWVGAAAYTFRSAFVPDAAMMNGLNHVLCSVAEQVDGLASGLSSIELGLERSLETIMQKGMHGFSVSWLCTAGSGTSPSFQMTSEGAAGLSSTGILQSDMLRLCNKLGAPFFEKANSLREQAATKLAAFGQTLLESLDYYKTQSAAAGSPSTSDISVLLTSAQAGSDSAAFNRLKADLAKDTGSLSSSDLNDPALAAALTNMGVKAQSVGSLIGDLKNVKEADNALNGSKAFLGLLGDAVPLLIAIGLGA